MAGNHMPEKPENDIKDGIRGFWPCSFGRFCPVFFIRGRALCPIFSAKATFISQNVK
jgi:hypothetical protein